MGGFFSAPKPTAASPNIKVIPKLTGMTFLISLSRLRRSSPLEAVPRL